MSAITFKRPYVEPILKGEKTTTLRAATALYEGSLARAYNRRGQPPFAMLRITSIERVSLEDLDDDLARSDGFEDAAALRAELARLYPGTERFVKLAFCVVEPGGAT